MFFNYDILKTFPYHSLQELYNKTHVNDVTSPTRTTFTRWLEKLLCYARRPRELSAGLTATCAVC